MPSKRQITLATGPAALAAFIVAALVVEARYC